MAQRLLENTQNIIEDTQGIQENGSFGVKAVLQLGLTAATSYILHRLLISEINTQNPPFTGIVANIDFRRILGYKPDQTQSHWPETVEQVRILLPEVATSDKFQPVDLNSLAGEDVSSRIQLLITDELPPCQRHAAEISIVGENGHTIQRYAHVFTEPDIIQDEWGRQLGKFLEEGYKKYGKAAAEDRSNLQSISEDAPVVGVFDENGQLELVMQFVRGRARSGELSFAHEALIHPDALEAYYFSSDYSRDNLTNDFGISGALGVEPENTFEVARLTSGSIDEKGEIKIGFPIHSAANILVATMAAGVAFKQYYDYNSINGLPEHMVASMTPGVATASMRKGAQVIRIEKNLFSSYEDETGSNIKRLVPNVANPAIAEVVKQFAPYMLGIELNQEGKVDLQNINKNPEGYAAYKILCTEGYYDDPALMNKLFDLIRRNKHAVTGWKAKSDLRDYIGGFVRKANSDLKKGLLFSQ